MSQLGAVTSATWPWPTSTPGLASTKTHAPPISWKRHLMGQKSRRKAEDAVRSWYK